MLVNKLISTASTKTLLQNYIIIKRLLSSSSSTSISSILATTQLSPSILQRAESLSRRYTEILSQLEETTSHNSDTKSLSQELSILAPTHNLLKQSVEIKNDIDSLREMINEASAEQQQQQQQQSNDDSNDELIRECNDEITLLSTQLITIQKSLTESVIPKDVDDYTADAIIEIRSGTGGDEASLFAQSLFQCYIKYSQNQKQQNWTVERLHVSTTDVGGLREGILLISSSPSYDESQQQLVLSPYGKLKYESGVHRVQRVPVNDVRIHTSTASVAVLKNDTTTSNNNNDTPPTIPPNELKIETMRASGAGGQHVNTTNSAVRITHVPTGITVSIQDERSQHQNRTKAMKIIAARVNDIRREEERKLRGEERMELMGGGTRSERVRTYNYPQDRVTDHRSKVTEYGMERLLEGNCDLVDCFGEGLRQLRREEVLRMMEDEEDTRRRKGRE